MCEVVARRKFPLTALTIGFFDDYRFHLKKEGYAPATINRHLCWLSRLMYRAVSQGTIRFNPFERAKYEAVERKPRFLNKGDVAKLLAFPLQDEGAELSRRMFLFSVFTGLAFADLRSLRASQIETNNEGKRYIRKARQKTEVESLIPLHPIAEQILSLYDKENSKGDYKIFPDTMSKGKLLTHLKAVGLACGIRTPLTYHPSKHRGFYKHQIINRLYFLSIKGGNDKETSELLYSTLFCHFKESLCLLQR